MKLIEVYRTAIEAGRGADLRTAKQIDALLEDEKERFEKLGAKAKAHFDKDRLWNPYTDSRLLFGAEDMEVKEMLWGIDVEPAEVLLADRLKEKGRKIDALMAHHPEGAATPAFHEVMHMMEPLMEEFNVPANVAEDVIAPRIKEVQRASHPANFNRTVDACRMLDVPMICLHSPCDLLGQRFAQRMLDKAKPEKVGDVVDALMELPEYEAAAHFNSLPEVNVGERGRKAGRVMVKFAGGTSGPKEMYESLSRAGVGTFVCMHIPEAHLEEAKKAHINVIVAGHMASDSLGVNLMADIIEGEGVKIAPFSGLLRVKRK
ncbi:MAG: NGG1p interacting factor NIF3 [Methanomassiliicoccales archaeon]|jgi:putative NIF3 family GTP cyclohydrolase 1 type 2